MRKSPWRAFPSHGWKTLWDRNLANHGSRLHLPFKVSAAYAGAIATDNGAVIASRKAEVVPGKIDGQTLSVTTFFRGETEHTLRVIQKTSDSKNPKVIGIARFYSLKPDYSALRPYRGNVHMHSKFSDGDKNETPALLVATCRKLGQDFAIQTDHSAFAGSLSAIAYATVLWLTSIRSQDETQSSANSASPGTRSSSLTVSIQNRTRSANRKGNGCRRRLLVTLKRSNHSEKAKAPRLALESNTGRNSMDVGAVI